MTQKIVKKTQRKIILPFHVVLLGQIAAGKDTQADVLKDTFAFSPVESGKYWRKLALSKTKEGEMLRKTTEKGLPAPVVLMKKFLLDHMASIPKNKTLLFVGNPRLKPEAQLLNKLMKEKKDDYVVMYISLPDKEIKKRSASRLRNLDDKIYLDRRIKWHKDQVSKSVNYFKDHASFKEINGNQSISKVTLDIHKALYTFLKERS
jgi:adenylate kinase family enzyme